MIVTSRFMQSSVVSFLVSVDYRFEYIINLKVGRAGLDSSFEY